MKEIEALANTWLKRHPVQAKDLADIDKKPIRKGKVFPVESYSEADGVDEDMSFDIGGHTKVKLGYDSGEWYIYDLHWKLPWQIVVDNPPKVLPEWNQVNWSDFKAPVSKYFTVGEVTNMSSERIPGKGDTDVKKGIIAVARVMDEIREWWGGPIGVNSWYRPWHVNTRIGSRAPNHPAGSAVDFRPLDGNIFEMQRRFEQEWFNNGKHQGGFGRGAKKGFIHIDLRGRRVWNY